MYSVTLEYMGFVARNHVGFCVHKPASASTQSDQRLCTINSNKETYMQTFNIQDTF